jgi:drug/metabolite transporter (DMT)-like permease
MALSVVLAVLAAMANAAASVLQRKAARREPEGGALSLQILFDLVRQPVWLAGIGSILTGFALQVAALATGPILLIQPILIVELAFTLVLSSFVFHARLHTREWVAIVGMSGGVALLLVSLAPSGGDPRAASGGLWALGCGVTTAVVAALVLAGHRLEHQARAACLGVAAGIWFGFTAALVSGLTAEFAAGNGFRAWQTYALLVAGPAGFLLLQNALRAGRLVASQPGLTLSNPLAAIGWGVAVFGEQVRTGAWVAADVAGVAAVAASTVLLARSPLLQDTDRDEEEVQTSADGSMWTES